MEEGEEAGKGRGKGNGKKGGKERASVEKKERTRKERKGTDGRLSSICTSEVQQGTRKRDGYGKAKKTCWKEEMKATERKKGQA